MDRKNQNRPTRCPRRIWPVFIYLWGKIPKKANRHGTDVSWFLRKWEILPFAGLPIAIREDHIVQITRDELVQHRIYHTPFLSYFPPLLYASSLRFASSKLYIFHNFCFLFFDKLHSPSCAFGGDTL